MYYGQLGEVKSTQFCHTWGTYNTNKTCSNKLGPEWKFDKQVSCPATKGFTAITECKRFQNVGSLEDCCLGINPGYPTKTCPSVSSSTASCFPFFDTQARNYLLGKAYKGDPYKLRNWVVSNPGRFDYEMNIFCNNHPADALCACIKSVITKDGAVFCPQVFDSKCVNGGYMTNTMKTTQCPTVIDCDVNISDKSRLINSSVDLNCNLTQNTATQQKTTTMTTTTAPEKKKKSPLAIIISIILFVIIAIVVFVYAVFSKPSPTKPS